MEPKDIQSEILKILKLADEIYTTFGLKYKLELSTRPDKHTIRSDDEWEIATNDLQGALDTYGKEYGINEGDGAFYGPKIDFHILDALNRTWQCGTVQLDMALPQRFELEYTAEDGTRKRPVMLHRAIFGSIERFFGIIIEHFGGRFPLWISPRQIRIISVADRHVPFAKEVANKLKADGFLVKIDDTSESVGKKVRSAQLDQVNYMLTIGDKEVENKTISLRTRDNVVHGELNVDDFLQNIKDERNERALVSPYSSKE